MLYSVMLFPIQRFLMYGIESVTDPIEELIENAPGNAIHNPPPLSISKIAIAKNPNNTKAETI
jgi:hypothetical protein